MSVDSFAADAVILTGSALHAAFIVIALLALSSGLEGVPGLVIGCATMVKEPRLAVENFAKEATLTVRHRGKEKLPTAATFGIPGFELRIASVASVCSLWTARAVRTKPVR
jgi:hypothetical protein